MNTRDALLAAILANPDEDTPRLMFADWLDEHGEPDRAEFIRVQIELARLREAEADLPYAFGRHHATGRPAYGWRPHDTPERVALLKREAELHDANSAEWRAGIPNYAGGNNGYLRHFRRGFVGEAVTSLGPFLKDPRALWERQPVETLGLIWAEAKARLKVPSCRALARARELSLLPGVRGAVMDGAELLAPYARCPHLANLRSLDVSRFELRDGGAAVLAASEHLRPGELHISCTGLTPAGLAGLLSAPFAAGLRQLWPDDLPSGARPCSRTFRSPDCGT
jgi:uncharacterized protein (TIGR02996 family)